MTKIAIYGVGLIGGSLALCFKGKPGLTVVGHSGNPLSVEKYLKREVVDHATTSFEEAAEGADFIFLCVPVGNLEPYLNKLSSIPLKPGCIITDVGSTKASVAEYASRLKLQGGSFIGGHPMAGKEKSGVEAATSHLFENAYYVLTPAEDTLEEAYGRLVELLQWTRAHIVKVDARLHDEIVGAISHLPHIIAVALVNQVARYNESNELYQNLAAGGFRDITRIASSDPIIWRDILINNKTVMLNLLKDWNEEVSGFIKLLEASDGEGIEQEFHKANRFRNGLPERRKGVIHSFYDIYVDVPDHPGVIGQITMLLGSHRVNLSNIQIIESREDVPGVLRLSFREESDMDQALELLKKDYTIHV
ncbi:MULTISPECIES: prephenate dehydrogenase [unclassified Paenibacillus]|uniref:prephenate dehydrogenase n=1 Tax=unclassified Paenibacillus TaxID=185978 RepID=UPI001AE4800C|nr:MULTISPECIES: prephenate dehydrogenase [unclassified Paenibacillus]MBP1155276.1 prephenate dehydrogenase [Paenibacillus sp. PvP091]MBP1169340.1 prephenate dehydrogenase [Paenibacillus sp. PvR098]MBP2440368.1 prephenate dehydrogenase [Paenibacillus sp. PvP052]